MGAPATYLRHLKEAVTSIFDGMAVSASHLIRRPYTIQYPDRIPVRVQDTLPFRYRGILDVDMEICTGCLACDRACPIDCIAIAIEKNAQTREIIISQFDIDIAKCMYCGLCSEPCPTGAIHHTTEFEGADFSLESLIRRFITEPVVAYKAKKGPEPDAEVASLLDRGMKYVDEWAQPGSDKPPAGKAGPAAAKPASAAPGPVTPGVAKAAAPRPQPVAAKPAPASDAALSPDAATPAATKAAEAGKPPINTAATDTRPSEAETRASADATPPDTTRRSDDEG
ncbi:MAG TPA: 4Fe-4S binding protein [Candidatus Binataceae bacterium]|nr:4Fe-4S binding protein [Candidatus Binataceae bacterium]